MYNVASFFHANYRISMSLHSEKPSAGSFQIERNTTAVTFFILIMNQTEVHLVHSQKYIDKKFKIKVYSTKCIQIRYIILFYT